MNDSLKIVLSYYSKDGYLIKDIITLYPITDISPFGDNDKFIWEAIYKNEKISVKLLRGKIEEDAEIIKPHDLDINWQIISELKRVLRKLN